MSTPSLGLEKGDTAVRIAAERGALVTSIRVAGKELLYLDEVTLADPTKNVRGGIPVLFPYAGKLEGELLVAAGTKMKQHGFGRNRPWAVQERRGDRVRLRLVQDAETRAVFPFEYDVEHVVTALPRGAELRFVVQDTGRREIPLSPGWHPYFRCPASHKAGVEADVPGWSSDRIGDDREFDFGLEAPPSGKAAFEIPQLGTVRIEFSPEMRHMQFWSLPGKDFICLEPFFGPANAINTERRLEVPPGETRELWMRIELAPTP